MKKSGLGLFFLFLAGCFQTEESCRDTLDDELEGSYNALEHMLKDPDSVLSSSGIRNMQTAISAQRARLNSLYLSPSSDVCEFYLDGIYLKRK